MIHVASLSFRAVGTGSKSRASALAFGSRAQPIIAN